jgi:8-oxo-dGTP diphosphatase
LQTIELFADGLLKKDVRHLPKHISCRAVVQKNDQVLCIFLTKLDIYNLPGGGLEPGETPAQCVIRELKEETGYQGLQAEPSVVVIEYFKDSVWESRFYTVQIGDALPSLPQLTKEEAEAGVEVLWLDLLTLMDTLENYPSKNPYGSNIHTREFLGLVHSLSQISG